MADLQVVFLQDLLPVSRVEPINSTTPALRVRGKELSAASAVLINGIEAPAFLVTDRHSLVVEIPSSQVGDLIRSVAVLSSRITKADRSVLTFRIGGSSARVSGILRLVQRYVLMLMTNPGSDVLNPSLGGGLLNLVGKTIQGNGQGENVRTGIQQSISKTTSDLRKIQTQGAGLPPDETLLSALLVNVNFDARTTTLAVRLQLESAAGQLAVANLFI